MIKKLLWKFGHCRVSKLDQILRRDLKIVGFSRNNLTWGKKLGFCCPTRLYK